METKVVDLSRADGHVVYLERLIASLSPAEKISALKDAFFMAADRHNDNATLDLLGRLKEAFGQEEYRIENGEKHPHLGNASARAREKFTDFLKEAFFKIPASEKIDERYSDSEKKWMPVFSRTLPKTKEFIWKTVAKQWTPDLTLSSINAFNFLTAIYSPIPKYRGLYHDANEYERLAYGRTTYSEEAKGISDFIQFWTDSIWESELVEQWLARPRIPKKIEQSLILAWARNGGRALVNRYIKFAKQLRSLDLEQRSQAALDLHDRLSLNIKGLDEMVKELISAMHSGSSYKADRIGETEFVPGKIEMKYETLDKISLTVLLNPEGYTEDVGQDICGRVRRHVTAWQKRYPDPPKVNYFVGWGKESLSSGVVPPE